MRQRSPSGSKVRSTFASSASARLRSITMLPKPLLRRTFTRGPSSSRQSSASAPPSAGTRSQAIETRPSSSYVFTVAELTRMLAEAGFEVLSLNGGFAGEPYELGSPRLVLTAQRA